jgi:hypothetical protein
MWDPQRLTTLWASMASYRANFTLLYKFIDIFFSFWIYCFFIEQLPSCDDNSRSGSKEIRSKTLWRYINLIIYFLDIIRRPIFINLTPEIAVRYMGWAQLSRIFTWGRRQSLVSETFFEKNIEQWVMFKKSIILVKIFPAFYGTREIIRRTFITRAC